MKNILKKIVLIMMILIIIIIGLVACAGKKLDNYDEVLLNGSIAKKDEAKVLGIKEVKVDSQYTNGVVVDRIENISKFNISDIWIVYNELDRDSNIISESKMFLDMTLTPGDVFKVSFKLKEFGENVSIISYEYKTPKENVTVKLKEDSIYSVNINDKAEESSTYEVLAFSDIKKIEESNDGDTYMVKVKNNSSKNLGNITLKIGEINKDEEYIGINHESSYSALKPLEEAEITIKASKYTDKIKLTGYVYDDIDTKSNIDIDLISHKAQISEY